MRMKMLFAVVSLCVASLCAGSTAFARPQMQTVNKYVQAGEVTDVSSRRKVRVVKARKHHRKARRILAPQRYAAECFTIMPCEGVQPAFEWRTQRVVQRQTRPASYGVPSVSLGYSSSRLVDIARSQLGNGPIYGRRDLWCARFANYVVQRAGYRGTGSDMASSFASYGQRVAGPQVGAIAVMSRGRRGGHVGIVSGIAADGNPIIISGNHARAVREAEYPAGRVYAYVVPR